MAGSVVTGNDRFLFKIANLYRLHEFVDHTVEGLGNTGGPFSLTPELLKRMHAIAMDRLLDAPGSCRKCQVSITNCPHIPPNWVEVETQVKSLCDYVNANWDARDLIHLSAFVLWRLNWIHPFENGNGRTSRAAAYLVLCAKFGQHLPAKKSIVEQIISNRMPYYEALRFADEAYKQTQNIDIALQKLEELMSDLLTKQLAASLS